METRRLLAADFQLVKDINPSLSPDDSSPDSFVVVGDTIYFSSLTDSGAVLCRTNGTSDEIEIVRNFGKGFSSRPRDLTNVSGVLYFTADDGPNGVELWKSDGTAAGTVLVKDIRTTGSSFPAHLTNVNGTLFFSANDGSSGIELWKSDGMAAGTVQVKDIFPEFRQFYQYSSYGSGYLITDPNSSAPDSLINMGGTLYFAATDKTSGTELWRSDGTAEGTFVIKDMFEGTYETYVRLGPFNGYLANLPNNSEPTGLTEVGGVLYFAANDGSTGRELWRTDGSSAGTSLVRDIFSGSSSSSPEHLTNSEGVLYFTAKDAASGQELWKSTGTDTGTTLVRDIRVGTQGSYPQQLTDVAGALYFSTNDGSSGTELWKSNGTGSGTARLKDMRIGAESSYPSSLTNVSGTLYFSANDGALGAELWKSDGTATGTVIVKDIRGGVEGASPSSLANVKGKLYFNANDGTLGVELWRSDGTVGGTVVSNLRTENGVDSGPAEFMDASGILYFSAETASEGRELWRSDGTATGTVLVKDIRSGTAHSNPGNMVNVNGVIYFTANDGTHGIELWKTDGSTAGTVLVRDLRTGSAGSEPASLTNVNGVLYFAANDGTNGFELWKTDGTPAGTTLVKDIVAGTTGANPHHFANHAGVLYFTANGTEFWASDGTATGTVMVADIGSRATAKVTGSGGLLYFLANSGASNDQELWKSDGTLEGTVLVKTIGTDDPYASPDGRTLINVSGTLYFSAYSASDGEELWKSNGTAAGTMIVRNIFPGSDESRPNGSTPDSLINVAGTLYFEASDGAPGRDIWKSNGTVAGTVKVKDKEFHPGYGFANSRTLHAIGNRLFNAIPTEDLGRELYVADLTQGTTGNDVYTLSYNRQGPQSEVTVTLSTNVGPVTTLGTFSTSLPLSLSGLGGNDSVRIVGTTGRDVYKVSSTGLWFNDHRIILNSIENRTLAGGAGDDEYRFDTDGPLGLFTLDEALGGRDTLSFEETSTRAVDVKLGVSTTQVVNAHLSLILGSSVTFENVNGGAASDILVGNANSNVLRGNAGHDLINGTQGSDTLIGGLGNDTYSFGASTPGEVDTVTEWPSQGTDTLSFESLTVEVQLNLSQTTAQQVHSNRKLTLNSGSTFENVFGGTKNDTLTGNGLSNVLRGNAGHDVLNGTSGSDELVGGIGNDLYTFGVSSPGEVDVVTELPTQGIDTLSFTSLLVDVNLNLNLTTPQLVHTNRRLKLSSGAAIENANGGAGNDSLTGNALSNQLRGNAGNDSLNGTLGNDILAGGTGNDTYTFGASVPGEEDVVTELSSQGTDTLSFVAVALDIQANLNLSTAQTVHANRKLKLNSGSTFENFIGGAGNDTIIGNSLNNTLLGNGGNDILLGNAGNDRLLGGSGRDLLIGGLGRDSLDGGTDDDILIAGRTTHDGLTANLNIVRQDWSSSLSYTSRVSRLRSGVGSPAVSLKARTSVLNDAGDDDSVSGGSGSDWFIRALDDAILDLATGELIDLL